MTWHSTLCNLVAIAAKPATEAAQTAEQAAEQVASTPFYQSTGVIFLLFLGIIAATFWAGSALAKSLRMADYGWKLGIISVYSSTPMALFGALGFRIMGNWRIRQGVRE